MDTSALKTRLEQRLAAHGFANACVEVVAEGDRALFKVTNAAGDYVQGWLKDGCEQLEDEQFDVLYVALPVDFLMMEPA